MDYLKLSHLELICLFEICFYLSINKDLLIEVNKDDNIIGYRSREEVHLGGGVRHRAFSILIFNSRGQQLLQKRSRLKQLWPLYWSNACCSHPRKGETTRSAATKRLSEELGFCSPLKYLGKISYRFKYKDIGSETEISHVFMGRWDGPVRSNNKEVIAVKWIKPGTDISNCTPWFQLIMQKFFSQTCDDAGEIFERVDEHGQFLGTVTRQQAHQDKTLIHKAVNLVIFDAKGRILLQKRSRTKDLYPGLLAMSVGGHTMVGESFEQSIIREAKEELGLKLTARHLNKLGEILVRKAVESEYIAVFAATSNGPFKLDAQETEEVYWFGQAELAQKIKQGKIRLSPATKQIFTNPVLAKKIFRQLQ